jgi:hypothetical protein
MKTPKLPNGEDRVALGTKVTKKGKVNEGFAVHTSGKHAEGQYKELGRNPSQKQELKPNVQNRPKGGRNA